MIVLRQNNYSRAVNKLIRGGGRVWDKKNAISATFDKSEELAASLGKMVKAGKIDKKQASVRLNRIRSASNNRIDKLRDAANSSWQARNNVNYEKPSGPIMSRLENHLRTGSAFHSAQL